MFSKQVEMRNETRWGPKFIFAWHMLRRMLKVVKKYPKVAVGERPFLLLFSSVKLKTILFESFPHTFSKYIWKLLYNYSTRISKCVPCGRKFKDPYLFWFKQYPFLKDPPGCYDSPWTEPVDNICTRLFTVSNSSCCWWCKTELLEETLSSCCSSCPMMAVCLSISDWSCSFSSRSVFSSTCLCFSISITFFSRRLKRG